MLGRIAQVRNVSREGDDPMTEGRQPDPGRQCPWCSAAATAEATHCGACGAALAQRESIGDLVVPGVTTVDPALQAIANQPLRLRGASPTQSMASGAIAAAVAGGPVGLAALGGLAAVATTEYLGAGRGGSGAPADLGAVGRPSEAVLQAVERLEHDGERETGQSGGTEPTRETP